MGWEKGDPRLGARRQRVGRGTRRGIRGGQTGLTDGQVSWGAAQGQDSRQAWPDSPALIPAWSWVAAEAAAGGSPWGLQGGLGAADCASPRARGGGQKGVSDLSGGASPGEKAQPKPHLALDPSQLPDPGRPPRSSAPSHLGRPLGQLAISSRELQLPAGLQLARLRLARPGAARAAGS